MQLWAGRLLIFVAVAHLGLALASIVPHLALMAPENLPGVTGVPWHPLYLDRQAAFWSSLGSFAGPQLLWGVWVVAASRSGQPLPRGTGVALLALTVLQIMLVPISGFWFNLLPALLLLASEFPARAAPGGSRGVS